MVRLCGRGRSAPGNIDERAEIHDGMGQTGLECLFELFVRVEIDGMVFRGHGSKGVFAEIEASLGDRLFRLPVGDAEIAVFVFIGFFASGDKAKMLGPAEGHVVEGEFGGVAEMGIPTFALADEKDGVAGIYDDVAAVAKIQSEGCARRRRLGEEDAEGIFAAVTQLLPGEALILEKGERRAGIEGDGFDLQGARELDEEELLAAGDRTEIDGGISLEGVVREDSGVDVVAQSGERNLRRRIVGRRVGSPDIVMRENADEARLPDHEIFRAHFIGKNVKWAGDNAIEPRMEEMAWSGGKFFKQDAE